MQRAYTLRQLAVEKAAEQAKKEGLPPAEVVARAEAAGDAAFDEAMAEVDALDREEAAYCKRQADRRAAAAARAEEEAKVQAEKDRLQQETEALDAEACGGLDGQVCT